jgi:carboxymethylenebutenolidase
MNQQGKTAMCNRIGLICMLFLIIACQPPAPSETGAESDSVSVADQAAARENVEAMSREHSNDGGTPSAAADIAPDRAVISDPRMAYADVRNELSYGHFVFPEDMVEPLPAIIVIHEWWGLNDGVRAMAERLAGLGYVVLAVDLFQGQTASTPDEARELMLKVVENPERASENIRQAYQFLETTTGAPRIASLGWCFGGGWSLNTALLFPDDLDAAVIYYGQVTDDERRLSSLNMPILGIFAEKDTAIPVASARRFRTALENLEKVHEIEIFPGVGHAFANPTGNTYNEKAAGEAWERTVAFLDRHLLMRGEE